MIYLFVTKLNYAFTLLTSLAILAGLMAINTHFDATVWQTRNIGEIISVLTVVYLILMNLCHFYIRGRVEELREYDEIIEMVKDNLYSAKRITVVYFASVLILLFTLFSIETQFINMAQFLHLALILGSVIVAIAIPVYLYRVYRAAKEQQMEFFKDKIKGK